MNILSGVGRWLLAVVVILSLTIWIGLAMLQSTLLNRPLVFGWLSDSGVYKNALSAVLQLKPEGGQTVISQATFQRAASDVFTPTYLQQQTEGVLNNVYDWAEGKKPTISFSVPVNDKQADFSTALTKELTAEFAKLPACPTRSAPNTEQPTCVPQGMSAADFAAQFSKLDTDEGNFLTKPLTQNDFGGNPTDSAQALPGVVASSRWAVFVLPVVIAVSAAGFVLLSASKLQGLATVGKRVFFYTVLLTIGGGLLWIFGGSLSVGNSLATADEQGGAIVAKIIQPLLQQALPDIGMMLTLFAGLPMLIGAAAWVTGRVLQRKQQKPLHTVHTPQMPIDDSPAGTPPPPANPTPPQKII